MKNKYLFLLLLSALSFGQISQVKDINAGTANSSTPTNLFNFNGTLFFRATDGTNGVELWKSDGTEAGTVMVKDINTTSSAASNSNAANFTAFNNQIYFTASNGTTANGSELWKTDGTESGTVNVVDQPGTGNSISWIENLNGNAILSQLVVTTTGRELYKSDGTSANSSLILDIYAGTSHGVATTYLKNGNTIYFQGNSGTTGFELWKTDGTEAGTIEVADINSGTGSSTPDQIQCVNGVLYFFASDDGTNYDFYKYENNTLIQLVDFNTITSSVTIEYIELNGIIYFTADSDKDGSRELWQTDGTKNGTVAVSSLISGSIKPIGVSSLTKVGNKLFFAATVNDGQELFTYTPPTLSVKDQDKLEAVAVYPNPSDGNLFINNTDNETIQYEVFDVLGKRQAAGQTNDNSLKLNLKTGLYILKLTKNSQTSTTKIIIK